MQTEAKFKLPPELSHCLDLDEALGRKGQRMFCVTPVTFLLINGTSWL